MPDLPRKKVGLIACSGEDHPLGTVGRVAVRLVLEKLRPDDTVTLCLPLFLAGEEGERTFARFYPTIAVDSCGVACAARATAQYSGPVVRALDLEKLLAGLGITSKPGWRRRLDAEGMAAAEEVAAIIARQVDQILGPAGQPAGKAGAEEAAASGEVAGCSCGSGIPVLRVQVEGQAVELLAVPAVFDQFRQEGRVPSPETTAALLAQARLYNNITPADEAAVTAALDAAYREQWAGPK